MFILVSSGHLTAAFGIADVATFELVGKLLGQHLKFKELSVVKHILIMRSMTGQMRSLETLEWENDDTNLKHNWKTNFAIFLLPII